MVFKFNSIILGVFSTFSFLTDRAEHQFHISPGHTHLLLSVSGAMNFVGKIIFGWALDHFRHQSVLLTTIILFINAVSVLMMELWPTFTGQVVSAVLFGFSIGSYDTSIIVIFKILCSDITVPLGVSMFVFAMASLIGPTATGVLYDMTGSYRTPFIILSSLSFIGMLLLPCMFFLHRRKQKTRRLIMFK